MDLKLKNKYSLIAAIIFFLALIIKGVFVGVYDLDGGSFSFLEIEEVIREATGDTSGFAIWIVGKLPLFIIALVIISVIGIFKDITPLRTVVMIITIVSYIWALDLFKGEKEGLGNASYLLFAGLIISFIGQIVEKD